MAFIITHPSHKHPSRLHVGMQFVPISANKVKAESETDSEKQKLKEVESEGRAERINILQSEKTATVKLLRNAILARAATSH